MLGLPMKYCIAPVLVFTYVDCDIGRWEGLCCLKIITTARPYIQNTSYFQLIRSVHNFFWGGHIIGYIQKALAKQTNSKGKSLGVAQMAPWIRLCCMLTSQNTIS